MIQSRSPSVAGQSSDGRELRLLPARWNAEAAHGVFPEAAASPVAYELGFRTVLLGAAGNRAVLGPDRGPVVAYGVEFPGTSGTGTPAERSAPSDC
ncbi:hypothetical protein [Streptomyces sp. SYSU K217416]